VIRALAVQILYALAYYAALIAIVRLAGKRLGGQITTFDLVVLIQLAVVLQSTAFQEGFSNALAFIATVLVAHRGLAVACARSSRLRRLVRGTPRPLVQNGRVSMDALAEEGLSYEELLAGLRKQGHESPDGVKLATLEETGQISVIARK
jgi:uncharacterized membrane protein YcaP (DUF421 family)